MQDSAIRRTATVQGIQFTVNSLSELVRRQSSLTGSELKDGLVSVSKGAVILLIGFAGLILMAAALMVAGLLAFALLAARATFFLMAKSYKTIESLESRLQSSQSRGFMEEETTSSEVREIA